MANSKWAVDTAHSSITFTIRHMMFSKVNGSFGSFDAQVDADPQDLTAANIQLSIDLSSIDTKSADRDAHLRTADFFDVENNPKLTFESTSITKKADDEYNVTGNVNLHGVTRPETFVVNFEGTGKDPWGNEKVGFSATGTLKRSDYGLTWNAALETGGVLVGDDVKVSIEIQASKQA